VATRCGPFRHKCISIYRDVAGGGGGGLEGGGGGETDAAAPGDKSPTGSQINTLNMKFPALKNITLLGVIPGNSINNFDFVIVVTSFGDGHRDYSLWAPEKLSSITEYICTF